MGIEAYSAHFERRRAVQVEERNVPPLSDPLATTIRIALDARKLGLSQERAAELMLERGAGLEVEEHQLPGGG